jgi:hypothetical protein
MEDLKKWHVDELAGMYKRAIGVVLERSKKYATEDDPFRNFRSAASFAGTSVTQGLLTRIGDKLARLTNTLQRDGEDEEFVDESLDDTFIDLCNYFIILRNWRIVERREKEEMEKQLALFDEVGGVELDQPEEVKEPGVAERVIGKLSRLAGIRGVVVE